MPSSTEVLFGYFHLMLLCLINAFKTLRCLEEAKNLYPEKVSLDVIFGRPGQSVEDWDHELNQVNYHLSAVM